MARLVGITGTNGLVGGFLVGLLRRSGFETIPISTRPSSPGAVKLTAGRPDRMKDTPETLIHCGGLVGGGFSDDEYEYANVLCTGNLLNWCVETGVKHFIFFSTGGVYGPREGWVDENMSLAPEGAYAASKARAEEAVLAADLPLVTIIRLYFPIGPLTRHHFFQGLFERIKSGRLFLNGPLGRPHISPIALEDVGRLTAALAAREMAGVFNLSANKALSILEAARIIAESTGLKLATEILDLVACDYLGKADKVLLATGAAELTSPAAALRRAAATIGIARSTGA